jgi:hypothetical protein
MTAVGTGSEETTTQTALIEQLLVTLAEREARVVELEARAEALESERDRLRRVYEQLKEELLLVKRRLFIAKAERVDTRQLELEFAELSKKVEALAGQVPDEDEDQRPRRKRRRGRRNLAEAELLEVKVEVPEELFEKLVAEGKAERIGTETSYRLGYERGGYRRIAIKRVKYRVLDSRGSPRSRSRRCRRS